MIKMELFTFAIYHGAEMHVRINGLDSTDNQLIVKVDGLLVSQEKIPDNLTDGVFLVKLNPYYAGLHNVEVTLVQSGVETVQQAISFIVPEPIGAVSQPARFKDFWIAVGQPGAYTHETTYVNGLGEVKPYYERVIGVFQDFKIKIKHTPYSLMPKVKNISVQSFKDEDGDDMWLPCVEGDVPGEYKPQLTHEVVELNPTFIAYFPDNDVYNANQQIKAFQKAIEGRWLKIWDEYTQIGYDGVVLIDNDDDPKFKRRNYDYVEFQLKFKVNGQHIDAPFEGIRL